MISENYVNMKDTTTEFITNQNYATPTNSAYYYYKWILCQCKSIINMQKKIIIKCSRIISRAKLLWMLCQYKSIINMQKKIIIKCSRIISRAKLLYKSIKSRLNKPVTYNNSNWAFLYNGSLSSRDPNKGNWSLQTTQESQLPNKENHF